MSSVNSRQKNGSRFTRREATWIGAASIGLAMHPDRSLGNLDKTASWIDAHVHVWTPDIENYPLAKGFTRSDMRPASFTPDELMAHARPTGVSRIVLIQMSFYGADNSYMLDVMKRHPHVYSGVAVVEANAQPEEKMKQLAQQGVRGFRIRPEKESPATWLKSDAMSRMWRCGADENLAMCHLIDANYLPAVEQMCRKFPRTPVVIDHLARIGVDGVIRQTDVDRLCRLARHKEVTVKLSAFYALGQKQPPYDDLGPMIRQVVDAFGVERLMWASDCPYQVQGQHTYAASVDLIKARLDFLSPSDRNWILQKTAERVFFS